MDEVANNLFSDLGSDYYQTLGAPNRTGSPERRLLLAILERAILDYVGNDEREATQASEWLFGWFGTQIHDHFSFPWLCEQLDLDCHKIALQIKAMPKRGSRRVAPWYFSKTMATA
jgi:hypothetical protein